MFLDKRNNVILILLTSGIWTVTMEKKTSAELLNVDQNNSKNASSDSLNTDSKSSSLNSKMGQESVRFISVYYY